MNFSPDEVTSGTIVHFLPHQCSRVLPPLPAVRHLLRPPPASTTRRSILYAAGLGPQTNLFELSATGHSYDDSDSDESDYSDYRDSDSDSDYSDYSSSHDSDDEGGGGDPGTNTKTNTNTTPTNTATTPTHTATTGVPAAGGGDERLDDHDGGRVTRSLSRGEGEGEDPSTSGQDDTKTIPQSRSLSRRKSSRRRGVVRKSSSRRREVVDAAPPDEAVLVVDANAEVRTSAGARNIHPEGSNLVLEEGPGSGSGSGSGSGPGGGGGGDGDGDGDDHLSSSPPIRSSSSSDLRGEGTADQIARTASEQNRAEERRFKYHLALGADLAETSSVKTRSLQPGEGTLARRAFGTSPTDRVTARLVLTY